MSVILLMMVAAAEVAGNTDTMVSGNWIIMVIGALSTAVALYHGKRQGAKEATSSQVSLQSPVPVVPVTKIPGSVSWNDHVNLVDRVARLETHLDALRKEQGEQFRNLLESGQEREQRLASKIEGIARDWHARMDSQFGPKPRVR